MRTIRLMAVASPVAATVRSQEQPECVYAVASDETFWVGEWKVGEFNWRKLPALPSEAPDAD